MGAIKRPAPVHFFASIIFKGPEDLTRVVPDLAATIGQIQEQTAIQPFIHSDYYEHEMGPNLSRTFLLFTPLLPRDELVETKLKTNEIERRFSVDGRRHTNIDPGYIALEHIVLATTKGYTHRLYLGRGIFGDLTLMFRDGSYHCLEWTYPDYAQTETISLFNRWREIYRGSLRCQGA